MRHTEFWIRLEEVLGPAYARSWADQFVMSDLGGRTASEALDAGLAPKRVWTAVCEALEIPEAKR